MKPVIKIIIIGIFIFSTILSTHFVYAEPTELRYFQTDTRYDYRIQLLELAMKKTETEYGLFRMAPIMKDMSQNRGLVYLKRGGKVNVAFLPTSKEREKDMLPVKIPIMAGVLGYRVNLIHKDNLNAFSKVKTFDRLRSDFVAGFGSQWADIAILEANEIKVEGVATYETLFKMLQIKRFDYFPRGINEAWMEVEKTAEKYPDIVVDPHLALYYPYPVYFFVNKKDTKLAKRIRAGLESALKDGSFKALFLKFHEDIIERADIAKRNLFKLKNPVLPEDFVSPDTSWWLQPEAK